MRSKPDRKFTGDLMELTPSVFYFSSFHGANYSENFIFQFED